MSMLDPKKLIGWDKKFWKQLGVIIKKLIVEDALKGVLQSGKFAYKSRQYVKYKANHMNRFTDGKKLKSLQGQSVTSSHTGNVNMMLTGRTLNSLVYKASNLFKATYEFGKNYHKIIQGNFQRGYAVNTLNDKNQQIVRNIIQKDIEKRIKKTLKPIKITINA